jgi:hypothetical protein
MIWKDCPNCGEPVLILDDELEVHYCGGMSVRIDGKAYCEKCDDNFYGSWYVDIPEDEWEWDDF